MKMSDYVETDIGEFPKDWEVKKLKDIITYKKGVKPKQLYIKRIDDNYVPYLTAEYLRGQSEPRYVDMNEKRLLVAEPEDILMIWDGSAAGDLFTGFRGAVASTFVRIKCNRNIINCKYLYYYLLERVDILKKRTKGTGIPHINKDTFENLQIPLPPLEEQKKIVELLQKATDIYYTLKDYIIQIRNSTETITKVIRKELLTKGIGHRDYVETDIGEFPMEWDVKRLNELAKIIMGQSPPSSAYNNKGQGLPFLQGSKDFGDIYPSIKTFTTICKKKAPKDSILLSVRAPVGDINISDREICIGRGIAAIVPHNKIDLIYLYYYLTYSTFKIKRYSSGTTFESIKKSDLENFQIPLPPLEEQKKIVELLQKVDELIIRFNDFLQNLEDEANTLYKSILRLALTGKLTEDWRRQIILLRSVVIPYLVYQASKIKGRPVYMTELMKYLFLLQKEYNINLAYNFESYKYGPFTPQLYKDLEELKDRIEVKEVKDNVDKSLITSKELPQVNQDIANAVNDLINRFGNKDLKELLSYVYKKYPEYTVKSELNLDEFLK